MSKADSTTPNIPQDKLSQAERIDLEIAKCMAIREAQLREAKNAPPAQPAEQMPSAIPKDGTMAILIKALMFSFLLTGFLFWPIVYLLGFFTKSAALIVWGVVFVFLFLGLANGDI